MLDAWYGRKTVSAGIVALAFPFCFSPQAWPQSSGARVANTTLRLPPEPPAVGFTLTNIFRDLIFDDPVCVKSPPGETNRLFVVERTGRIIVITNLAAPSRAVFLDLSGHTYSDYLEAGLLGLAFHPGYATNRYFYLFRTAFATTEGATNLIHDVLSRFETSPTNANLGLPDSEQRLVAQYDDSVAHNGGDLVFGLEGYLYVALGEASPPPRDRSSDPQAIDQGFFGGILRIDVDKRPGSLPPNPHPSATLNYSIPPDNPFIGVTNHNGHTIDPNRVRTEFFAIGLRNPWRIAVDPVSGDLHCGDVGAAAWEEINLIRPGGNYGWPYREGLAGTPPPGHSDVPPLYAYGRGYSAMEGRVVIGGAVHHGSTLTELNGAYLFGDYVSGNIWALRTSGTNVNVQRLTSDVGVSAFGIDPRDGEILLANYDKGIIEKLVYQPLTGELALPGLLSYTGIFSDPSTLEPQPGILPYEINVPFWSDNARKRRWFSVPDPTARIGFQNESPWTFPPGTVWIKHFDLALTNGAPESERRVETRVLVKDAKGVYGVTYRWNDDQSDATLVPEEGLDETFVIKDGEIERLQVWHFPGRQECLVCHTKEGGFALGFNSGQLDCDILSGSNRVNQVRLLAQLGYLDREPDIAMIRPLAAATNSAYPIGYRVRSYLDANCAQCHQGSQNPSNLGDALWDARFQTPTAAAGIINGPLWGDFGDPSNRVIRPFLPEHSIMLFRVAHNSVFHMPPLATRMINSNAVDLLTQWIMTFLPAPWQSADVGNGVQEGFDSVSEGLFSISGSGNGIGGTTDGFHFAYQTVDGNLQLVARTVLRHTPDAHAQSGVMIRANLGPGEPFVLLHENASNELVFSFRPGAGAETQYGAYSRSASPGSWMKLARNGDVVSGYTSDDGVTWRLLDSVTVNLGTNVAAGLAVTSGQMPKLHIADFQSVSLLSVAVSLASAPPFLAPADVRLQVQLGGDTNRLSRVEYFANGAKVGESVSAPYAFHWNQVWVGHYSLTAAVTDNQGITFVSAPLDVDVQPPDSRAGFVGTDPASGGSWQGLYGMDGAWIFGSTNLSPTYAALDIQGGDTYIWSDLTSDPRALETVSKSNRIAATLYATEDFSVDLAFTDGKLHQLALYFLDWDGNNQRSQTVEIWNDADGSLLDSRSISAFSSGTWLRWDIRGHVRIRIVRNDFGNAVLSGLFFDPPGNVPPSIRLTNPPADSHFVLPATIPIEAEASDLDDPIARVEFFINERRWRQFTNAPYAFAWTNALQGSYTIKATAVDVLGESRTTDPLTITVAAPAAAAEFVGSDFATQGKWIGQYGFNGFVIPAHITNYPAWARVEPEHTQTYIWLDLTDDPRALQYTNAFPGLAACWFDNESFSVEVNCLDSGDHKLSLYFLDWDGAGARTLTVDVVDVSNGAVLDSRTVSGFSSGVYQTWKVRGRIRFQITRLASNAVLSGMFFDPLQVSLRSPRLLAKHLSDPGLSAFQLDLRGVPNYPYRIDVSTNLVDWVHGQVRMASPSGRITILESFDTHPSARFYRAVLQH